jgi:hypothetical protein
LERPFAGVPLRIIYLFKGIVPAGISTLMPTRTNTKIIQLKQLDTIYSRFTGGRRKPGTI